MASEDDFITHLMGFGLTEKEAQCYFHLLRYGPKTPSPLAKALHTYREDMHRTLNSLIDKGMVRPSLDSPTVYTAVELETALESALRKHESELREMEQRKRELEELSRQQHFRPSDEVATFKVMTSLMELIATMLPVISTLKKEWDMVVPENAVMVASQFGINPLTREFIDHGGTVKILVTDFSYRGIQATQELIDIGAEVRYIGQETMIFTVFDKKTSISGINWELNSISLDQPQRSLFTDDSTYAQYLTATFEMLWQQAIPAEQRIDELLIQAPPQAD
ncbi:MAG: TrmB family transcriptional regulator [Halobacteriota archaeon]